MLDEVFVPHLGWFLHEPGDAVAAFLREGHFESGEQAFYWLFFREGDSFLDCGAHFGLFSVLASHATQQCGTIVSVEPNPRKVTILRQNLKTHCAANFSIVEAACWKETTQLEFTAECTGKAAYGHIGKEHDKRKFQVKALTLGQILDQAALTSVNFAKIDTEGAELEVLNGGAGAIMDKRLPLLMVEFTEANLQRAGCCFSLTKNRFN